MSAVREIRPASSANVLLNVQGLRAVAALLVVLVHTSLPKIGVEDVLARSEGPWLGAFRYIGIFGVDLFFVISGFIMLATNRNSFAKKDAGKTFLIRRAIRIYPPYWLAVAAIAPVYVFARTRFMVSHTGVPTGVLQSILLLPQPTRFLLPVAWTLVWELIFYVVFSQMLRFERRYVAPLLALWAVVELVLYVTLAHASNFYLAFVSTPLPLEFIFGACIGLLYDRGSLPAPRSVAALAIAATAAAWTFVSLSGTMLAPEQIARIALFGIPSALLVYAAVSLEMHGMLRVPRAVASLGDASYAIYLWHVSILVAVRQGIERWAPAGPVAHAVVIAVTIGIIVAFGFLVYHFFERPVTTVLNRALVPRAPRAIATATDSPTRHADGIAIAGIGSLPGRSRP